MNPGRSHHPHAFTLLEAMVVVIVVGVLAASAIPAASMITEMNRATASSEVVRLIEVARARSMATGRPHGVWFSVSSQAMRPVWIASENAAPSPARSQTGDDEPLVRFGGFGNATLKTYVGGDGISGEGTIWFATDGTPQARSSTGTLLGNWTGDATLQITGQKLVTVRRITGLVQ